MFTSWTTQRGPHTFQPLWGSPIARISGHEIMIQVQSKSLLLGGEQDGEVDRLLGFYR